YSGELREIGVQIDEVANFIWENFMKPTYQNFIEKGMQEMAVRAAEAAISNPNTTTSVPNEVSLNSPTHCRSANRRRPNINHPEISAAIPNTSRDVPAHPANTSRALSGRKPPNGTEWTGGAVGDTPAGRREQQNILRELPGPSGLELKALLGGTEWTGGAVGDTPAGRREQQNILRELPGPSGLAREWTGGAVGDTPAGRREQQNILRELPGPSGLARQGIDEDKLSSAWLLIIDDRILKHIEKCTEQEPRRCQEVDDWSVSLQELKAFIAILYARGATGAKGLELESLWSKK
ncbi:hypothetical protein QE152_g26687, partial [Popillia japonica]